ncbi:hypothetical protein IC229_33705 [Spirosoma sp. BT702]|uniref:DUF3168 domain-containing protein n=1 Tax=Spirosoma profusum TaxID=2771354 RepID=A0A927AW94_9BACT|nr:hypothetical protein [Spirosoma profusum]MBD2705613.1 hypothetical protein [Spirosoma profusum]
MIGVPIRALALEQAGITDLVAERISSIRFVQSDELPAIMYSTDDMKPVACRSSHNEYEGRVELSILATHPQQIEDLITALRLTFDRFEGISAGWHLRFSNGTEGPDDQDEDLKAYYKRIDYNVHAQKL